MSGNEQAKGKKVTKHVKITINWMPNGGRAAYGVEFWINDHRVEQRCVRILKKRLKQEV